MIRPTTHGYAAFLLGLAASVLGLVTSEPRTLEAQEAGPTVAEWRADLDELVAHVMENHRNPFHSVDSLAWAEAVAALNRRIPELAPNTIIGEFAKLLALIGDGHTRLTLPLNATNLGFRQSHTPDPDPAAGVPRFGTLPVRFADMAEGVYVVSATAEHEALIGARVVAVAGTPVEEALSAIHPFIARDTPAGLRFHATKWLAVPALLAEAELTDGADQVALTLEAGGATWDEVVVAVPFEEDPRWVEPARFSHRQDDEPYFEIDESHDGALVVRVLQINDSPNETIGGFSRRLSQAIERLDPEKVILDLRYCHGGDQSLSRALVLPLVRWSKSSAAGHVFALVGPETFSAAVNLASRLEEWTQITFVGEPLGSGPSHYSSSDREVLDHSNLTVRVSTGYFVGWTGSEWRESVEIGLPVKDSITDFLDGRDSALEAALEYAPAEGVADQIIGAYEAGGINAALIAWARYRTDPATARLNLEQAGNRFGDHLLASGELRFAASIYLFNREFHPNSIEAYLGEAESRRLMDDIDAARAVLEEALELSPDDERIIGALNRLGG